MNRVIRHHYISFIGGNMPRKKVNPRKYPITLSDWITFSESNSSINISLFILIGSFVIAFSVNFRITGLNVWSFVYGFFFFLLP